MARRRQPSWRRQHGAALLLALLIALMLSLTLFFKTTTTVTARLAREQATERAMAEAKAALIAWSVVQGDLGLSLTTRRPGTLPCPDTNNSGTQAASCSAASVFASGKSIGRLPWRTLGIEDLRDADGEHLWYALSNNFRRPGLNDKVINSDTQGTLQLYASNATTLLTPAGEELAAIIFSAGPPLTGQDRVAGPNQAANYLDAASPWNNASAPGPFISGPFRTAQGDVVINDRVMALSARELIGAIEKRALSEAKNVLDAYFYNKGKYPNPAPPKGPNCLTPKDGIGDINFCNSDNTACFGRFPEGTTYAVLWFIQNGWGRVLTYAVNKNSAHDPSAAECSTALTVDAAPKSYVLLAPGSARSGQARPSPSLGSYLEDAANNDAWTSPASGQEAFVKPSAASNDILRSLP